MSTATFERATTIQASEEEHSVIEAVQSFLASQLAKSTKLVGQDGQTILLSAALYEVLRQAALVLVQDEAVAIVPVHKLLTTNDAADILNISRPSLIQILERGELPYMMVGTHRRIRFGDLLSYKEARDARRRAALDRLVEQSEELGLYDRT